MRKGDGIMAVWKEQYILTNTIIQVGNTCFIQIPSDKFKDSHLEFPKKLVKDTKKKSVKKMIYTPEFIFWYRDSADNKMKMNSDDFEKIFAQEHRECHAKIYGRI